jgi:hypothetical protein
MNIVIPKIKITILAGRRTLCVGATASCIMGSTRPNKRWNGEERRYELGEKIRLEEYICNTPPMT